MHTSQMQATGAAQQEEIASNSSFSRRCKVNSELLSPSNRDVLDRKHKMRFCGPCPGPRWGAFSASQNMQMDLKGPYHSREGKGKGMEKSKRKKEERDLHPENNVKVGAYKGCSTVEKIVIEIAIAIGM